MKDKYIVHLFLYTLSVIFFSCSKKQKKINPEYQTLTESVYASITIEPENLYDVFPSVSGVITNLLISEGDTIHKGQVLALLDDKNAHLNLKNAITRNELANKNLTGSGSVKESLKARIRAAQAQLKLDSHYYAKFKRLNQLGIGKTADLDNARLKFEVAKSNKAQLQQQLQQAENELHSNAIQNKNNLKTVQLSVNDFQIKSAIDGIVYQLYKAEGELINPQFPIAQLGDGNQYLIQLLVDEVDISKIELKQPVLISLDAYPNQVFNAIVSKIYPIKDNRSQTFTIEAIFTTFPKKLYAGLSGEANIIINRREKVLTLPTYSLINDSTINTSDGERIIQIGYKSFDKIEVISGIDSSTVVLLP